MRISATCPRKAIGVSAASGFTIIEITVVLVIMTAIAAIAVPNLTRLYDAFTERKTLDEVLTAVRSASVHAFATGRRLQLADYVKQQVQLPAGWAVSAEKAIVVESNGVCRGGRLFVVAPHRQLSLNLKPPFCQPEI